MEPKPLFCRIWQTLLDIFYLSCNSGIFEGTSDKCNNKFVAFLHIQPLHDQIISDTEIQSNLAIRNILVALKLFLNAKSSLSLWIKCQIGQRKWSLSTNFFLIKPFLIAKFDCITVGCFFTKKMTKLRIGFWHLMKIKNSKSTIIVQITNFFKISNLFFFSNF
jgi:hypothetical protein